MARRSFFSFHYIPDNSRAGQVRNMGMVDGNKPVTDNDWEIVTTGGNAAIKKWITDQLKGRSCTIVLIGTNTAGRKWITHEISESWNEGMGVVGVRIHNLKNLAGHQSSKGGNPFSFVKMGDGTKMSSVVKLYNPSSTVSTTVYAQIQKNLAKWVEEAIDIRTNY